MKNQGNGTNVRQEDSTALTGIVQGDSKNMSPLAFKSNNSRPMSRTTSPDTAFERADNFLSNECIHSHSGSLSKSVVTGYKPKVVRFLRVQISDGFRRTTTLCFVIPLSQHNLHLICKMCTKHPRPTRASIIFSSHFGLSSKRPPRLAMHPFRRFVKACMALATRCWEIWVQQSLRPLLQVVDTLDLHSTPASPALPRRRSPCDVSALRRPSFRLEVSQADVVTVGIVRTVV